ncbi:MAG: CocE/NonD family hydrolase [Actinomycetota bacterium]
MRRRGLARVLVMGTLLAAVMAVPAPAPADGPTHYVEMADGTLIAVNVQFPSGASPVGGWPTIIQIDGYGGASDPMNADSKTFGNGKYVTVHMSLRGTGCSGGQFDLFDRRSSEDGRQVIEWLAAQEWSNGKVAIWGHSYSGLTGWLIASTQPPSLVAMSVSGLIDDLYRGIVYMGGVSNFGFPLIWTGVYRPLSETQSGTVPGLASGDATCLQNQLGRVPPDVQDNAILNGVLALGEDGQWWKSHSTITYLDAINIPTHIVQSYQDEQTGPRGSNLLWQRLDERKPDLPKRLLLTNGVHSTNTSPPQIRDDRIAFLDCYVRGVCTGDILDQSKRVKVFFEMHDVNGSLEPNGVLADANWPLDATQWTRLYFGAGNTLGPTLPAAGEAADPYVSGSKRAGAWVYYATNVGAQITTANLPDEVRYQTEPFASDVGIAGPIDVTLHASSLAVDTEFYVEVNDVDAEGNMTRLQRGMLKASHREIDPAQTDYTPAGDIYRPYNPHTNTLLDLITPGEIYQYEIEVFPLGHVFRAGHRLLLRITTPPIADSIAFYIPTTPPGVNMIHHDPEHPSSILLPIVELPPLGPALGCGQQVGLERCNPGA